MSLDHFWNWKKHPASVWYTAGPLIVAALGLTLLRAMIEFNQNNDPWFLVIWVCGIFLVGIALRPLWKYVRDNNAN